MGSIPISSTFFNYLYNFMSKNIKEVKLGLNISDHDLSHKLKQANKFIEKGLDVKFTLQVRGRSSKIFTSEEILGKLKSYTKDFRIVQEFNKGDNYHLIAKPPKN